MVGGDGKKPRRRAATSIVALAVWALLWLTPWPRLLAGWPWVGVVAGVGMLIAPGALLARAVRGRGSVGQGVGPGLALSMMAVGGLGLLACLMQWPLGFVRAGLAAAGAAAIVALGRRGPEAESTRTAALSTPRVFDAGRVLEAAAWIVPLLAAMAVAAHFAFVVAAGWDNFIYNAMTTDALRGDHLGFADPAFGPARTTISRLWLAFWPLAQASIAAVSGIDPLPLSAVYLNPVLAVLAVAAVFELAVALGLSRRQATLAAVVQVTVLLLLTAAHQPGTAFFTRLREDKLLAAFVVGPAWCRLVADYLREPDRRGAVLVGLGGAGMLFTHPTMLAVAASIIVMWAGLDALATRRLRPALCVIGLAAGLVAVPLGIRIAPPAFGASESSHTMYFTLDAARQAGANYLFKPARLELVDGIGGFRLRSALIGGLPGMLAVMTVGALAVTDVRRRAAHATSRRRRPSWRW